MHYMLRILKLFHFRLLTIEKRCNASHTAYDGILNNLNLLLNSKYAIQIVSMAKLYKV